MRTKKNYIGLSAIMILLALCYFISSKPEVIKVESEDSVETDKLPELITEVISVATEKDKVSKNALVSCEISFDENYTNVLFDLTVLECKENGEQVEYSYHKLNGEELQERRNVHLDPKMNQKGLTISEFEHLVSKITEVPLEEEKGKDYLLVVREYVPDSYARYEKDQAYEVVGDEVKKIDDLDHRIGISIKGKNEVSLVLPK